MWALVYLGAARRLVAAAKPGARYKLLQTLLQTVTKRSEQNALHPLSFPAQCCSWVAQFATGN